MLRLAPRIAPLDIEAYMKAHFTKVQEHMRGSLHTYLDRCPAAALDVSAIEALTRQLEPGKF